MTIILHGNDDDACYEGYEKKVDDAIQLTLMNFIK